MITQHREDSRMPLLYLVARELSESLDLDQIVRRVLIATVRIAGASHGSFFTFDETGSLNKALAVNDAKVSEMNPALVERLLTLGLAGWVKDNREAVLLSNASNDERWYTDQNTPNLLNHDSVLCVPLLAGQTVLGILTVSHPNARYFDLGDLTMLIAIAEQAATTILNARLYETEQKRRQLANTMAQISQQMNATQNLDELFYLILDELAGLVNYDQSAIYMWDKGHLGLTVAKGIEDISELQNLPVSLYKNDFAKPIINRFIPQYTGNLQTEISWFRDVTDITKKSWLGVPLVVGSALLGILTLSSAEEDYYSEQDQDIVNTLAAQAATAINNTRLLNRLQNTQKRYTQLFEESSDLLMLISLEGIILDANRRACQIFRRPKDAIIGSYLLLLGPHLRETFKGQIPDLNRGKELTTELVVEDAFGQQAALEINAKLVEINGEMAVQWAGRDVTARHELAKLREDLTNMIVHDLRGPTGTLIGTIQILSMVLENISGTPTYNEAQDLINIANRTGQYLQDLIDSVLDLSKMEQGDFPLNKTQVSLTELLSRVEEQVLPQAKMKQIDVTIQPASEETNIFIDRSLIRRVMVNLVDNAIKYTPSSGKVALNYQLNGKNLTVSIIDNGPGIPDEDQKHLFDKFMRATKDQSIQGVGLGLAFCQMAIQAHQGKIWVESQVGQGSKFSFTIPVQ